MGKPDNSPAFPLAVHPDGASMPPEWGLTKREWFAGMALANSFICDGQASQWELNKWFGSSRTAITRPEIIAKQALEFADAMLRACKEAPK